MSTSTLLGLGASKKGNLIYDKHWFDDGRIEEVVDHCSSPPQVSVDLLTAALTKFSLSSPVRAEQRDSPERSQSGKNTARKNEVQLDHVYSKRRSHESSPSQLNESSVERALVQVEQEWEQIAKERVKEREHQLVEHSRQAQEQAEQNVALLAQQRELKQRAVIQMMSQAQREMDEMREKRLQHQQERHKLHLKRLESKMKAAVLQREADEMEKKKRERERQEFLSSLNKVKSQVDDAARKLLHMMDTYPHKEYMAQVSSKINTEVQALCAKASSIVQQASEADSFSELEKTMQSVVARLIQKQEEAMKAAAEAERKFQEEVARKQKEKEKEEQEKAKKLQATKVEPAQPKKSEPTSGTTTVSLESCISPEALQEYTSLEERHKAVEESCKGLSKTTDKDVKKYRFDLQKAVNTPINSVSVQSGSHLLDKLHRLKDLLSGRDVDLAGKRVKATKPTGLTYVKELAAKRLVKQGDDQVSSNHESAFAFAAIAVALWQDMPEVGDLLLYHLYHSCPYLVPYHMAKKDEESLEDYYKSLGYYYESDGQIEKQDKFLKRMTGYTRLYAAIIATPPLRGQAHPHGVDRGWMYLSRVMNLEPQPDVTATTLFDFLEVCGQALAEAYGKQFFKLLQTLYKHYFSKIEAVTPQGSGGPVMRLKGFLEDCIRKQKVPSPKGLLSSDFWRS